MRALLFDVEHPDGRRRWAVPATDLVAVLPAVAWRPVPGGPPGTLGLFEWQGILVPLIDLSVRLGGPPATLRLGSRILLGRIDPERGDRGLVGFLLERMLSLDDVDFGSTSTHAGFDRGAEHGLGPIAPHRGGTVQLLSLHGLFDDASRGHLLGTPA